MDITLTPTGMKAILAPGLKLPNGATILASAPAAGTMPRFIVLASVPNGTRIHEYATWEVNVDATSGTVETYYGSYFPAENLSEALISFHKRIGRLDALIAGARAQV